LDLLAIAQTSAALEGRRGEVGPAALPPAELRWDAAIEIQGVCVIGSLRACVAGAASAPQLVCGAPYAVQSGTIKEQPGDSRGSRASQMSKRAEGKSRSAGPAVPNGSRRRLISASGFVIDATTSAEDGLLQEFYSDYDRAFVLENEKEGYDGFVECLRLNCGDQYDDLVKRYGPFREFVIVVREAATGARLAGANFIIFPLSPRKTRGLVLSMNLNYVFVNSEFRKKGVFRQLVGDLPNIAYRLFVETNAPDLPEKWRAVAAKRSSMPQVYMFIEQNDPFRMSTEDYERDTRLTGLDQVVRIGLWSRLGAKIVDFPYVQPPLSKDQAADNTLAYAVLGAADASLDACLLRAHLERFFGISVLKGADLSLEPTAGAQLSELSIACNNGRPVPLLDASTSMMGSALADHSANRPATLREALRRTQ
jgi:hypothetical protein